MYVCWSENSLLFQDTGPEITQAIDAIVVIKIVQCYTARRQACGDPTAMSAEASRIAEDVKAQLHIKTQLANGNSGYLSDNDSAGRGGRSSRSRSTRGRSQPFFIGVAGAPTQPATGV